MLLLFVFLFILLMRIVIVEVLIQKAATETVHQMAGILYPFESTLTRAGQMLDQVKPEQLEWIPTSVRQWLGDMESWSELPEEQLGRLAAAGLKPIVWTHIPEHLQGTLIHYDQLHIRAVRMPYITDHDKFFAVELQYELPISLPFYQRTIMIVKQADERVWFGL